MGEPDRDAWVRLAGLAELGVMTASLIHELRHPLFAAKAMAEVAQAREEGLRDAQLVELLEQLTLMSTLVDHYSGFGRPDGTVALFDLADAVDGALTMLAHRVRSVGAKIRWERDHEGLLVRGRPTAARQVVVNLLHNALDAVDGSGAREIEVQTGRSGGSARLIIVDRGSGVPEAVRDRLFEPFVTTKPVGRGTGLGLFIARRLVEETGGVLSIDFPDVGTRVEVVLPLAE